MLLEFREAELTWDDMKRKEHSKYKKEHKNKKTKDQKKEEFDELVRNLR
jgi:hypothetical protein